MKDFAKSVLMAAVALAVFAPSARADDRRTSGFQPVPGNSFISNFMNSALGTGGNASVPYVVFGGRTGRSGHAGYAPIAVPFIGNVYYPRRWHGRGRRRDERWGFDPPATGRQPTQRYQTPVQPPRQVRLTETTKLQLEKGLELLTAGECREAAQQLRRAALSSKDPVSLFWFAQALVGCAEYEYAAKVLTDNVNKWPTWLSSGVDPAHGFGGAESFEEVLFHLEEFVEDNPDRPDALFVLACELHFAGRFKEAAKLAREAAAVMDDNEAARAVFRAASAQLKLRKIYEAAEVE